MVLYNRVTIYRKSEKMVICRAKKRITLMMAVIFALALLAVYPSYASAEETHGDTAVDYLDYDLYFPVAIYADEEVVAVSADAQYYNKNVLASAQTEERDRSIIYFYGGNIYERPINGSPSQIYRSGNRLYYLTDLTLHYVEIGEFEEKTASYDSGNGEEPIMAVNFAVRGDRMIAITDDNIYFYRIVSGEYVRLAKAEYPEYYEELVGTTVDFSKGNVYITDEHDFYFPINSGIYVGSSYFDNRSAKFIADVSGVLCFSDGSRIYAVREDGKTEALTLIGEDGKPLGDMHILGISGGYGDGLVFVAAAENEGILSCKLMKTDLDGNTRDFLFDIKIETQAEVAFTPQPLAVRVKAGTRLHRGDLSESEDQFDYSETSEAAEDEDFVAIGEVCGTKDNAYYVLFGMSGYALLQKENAEVISMSAVNGSGVIIRDCMAYTTCVADSGHVRFDLKKGDAVEYLASYTLNDVEYRLIEKDGEQAFVLAGEITDRLLPSLSDTSGDKTQVSGIDRTMLAVIIIICSLAVLIFALFIILVKKEYIKI